MAKEKKVPFHMLMPETLKTHLEIVALSNHQSMAGFVCSAVEEKMEASDRKSKPV